MPTRVIVLGGGVAGMSAAHELIERSIDAAQAARARPAFIATSFPGARAAAAAADRAIGAGRDPGPLAGLAVSIKDLFAVVGETTGAANIRVTRVAFRLLDVGVLGTVPVYFNSWTVPSSGSIQLFEEQEYGYAFEIDSLARAERLSVVIGFVDDTGRWGEVSGTASVVR